MLFLTGFLSVWILAFGKINPSEKLRWAKKVEQKLTQRQSGTPALSYNAVHHLHCYCTKGFHWLCKTSTYKIINRYEDCLWTLVCQSGPISNSSKAIFLFLQVSTHIKLMLEQDYLLISFIHTYIFSPVRTTGLMVWSQPRSPVCWHVPFSVWGCARGV